MPKKIGIIGGSLGGLAAGILLKRLGYHVSIFEKSSRFAFLNQGRGAGIALPPALISEAKRLNLFDATLPEGPTFNGRTFSVTDKSAPKAMREIWKQSLSLIPFNWSDLYWTLRKRVADEDYKTDHTVSAILEPHTGEYSKCYITTHSSTDPLKTDQHEFDRIIAADGVRSLVRSHLFPNMKATYANYIAWRGIISDQTIVNDPLFNGDAPMFMFPYGHILFYKIPAHDYNLSKKMVLNWVMYEYDKDFSIDDAFIDKHGRLSHQSISHKNLRADHIKHLAEFAHAALPAPIAKIICQTPAPFIQLVLDYQAPSFVKGRVCLLGDAATILPHAASGALRALSGAISLAEAMDPASHSDIDASLAQWNQAQIKLANGQCTLAKAMGKALVTEPPPWVEMNPSTMNQWWNALMEGKTWHATTTTSVLSETTTSKSDFPPEEVPVLFKKNSFTPSYKGHAEEVEALCAKVANLDLENKNGFNTTTPRPKL